MKTKRQRKHLGALAGRHIYGAGRALPDGWYMCGDCSLLHYAGADGLEVMEYDPAAVTLPGYDEAIKRARVMRGER